MVLEKELDHLPAEDTALFVFKKKMLHLSLLRYDITIMIEPFAQVQVAAAAVAQEKIDRQVSVSEYKVIYIRNLLNFLLCINSQPLLFFAEKNLRTRIRLPAASREVLCQSDAKIGM